MAVTQIGTLISFSAGQTISSTDMNSNLSAIRTQFNALVSSSGGLYVGDNANANITVGITINMGASDGMILSCKSSDVSTGITTLPPGTVEADDFFVVQKLDDAIGGVRLMGLAEDAASPTSIELYGIGGTADTAKTTSAVGLINLNALEHDGSNGGSSPASNSNIFVAQGQGIAKFLVDFEGDWHYDGADGGAFDSEDDVALVRAFAVATSRDVIRTEFDAFVKYNEDDLVRLGILGDTVANGGLVNGAQLNRLLVGAVWQQEQRLAAVERRLLSA